ncbi:cyclin-like protein [Mytilinidion resinicola]|uniref:RNA polymerase II holoenzyme cyclin-like subunit n=1 Tax=Mytilinidion resinicola TaxID=574789 RepID=A0A6A6YQJ3_9PEZI|nr:cyclin-like protein [Mytilinidion resinicola]KAF2811176.1 cyclin-like protein [Mytilinidion resinicola]
MRLTEDEIYRSSTQFRLWSFTPEALASLRATTNSTATQRVKAAVKRLRESRNQSETNSEAENGTSTPVIFNREPDCLTVEEEMKVVEAFCGRAIVLGNVLEFPSNVIATGVQYLRRFYLFNSPMTYEPKSIMLSAMFLANKIEDNKMECADYAARITGTTKEQVLAPEFLITQALRFTFDVRHPFRGLQGGHMEMLAIAQGKAAVLPYVEKTAAEFQQEMLELPTQPGGAATKITQRELEKRLNAATDKARDTLKSSAIQSDAYFLYTPSQIWLAAYLLADEVLALFYLSSKFPGTIDAETPTGIAKLKIVATVRACAVLLAPDPALQKLSAEEKEAKRLEEINEVKAIHVKLRHCRDPDKMDLVKLNKAQKRDAGVEGKLEESVAKRRKLEREKNEKEADEFWGPELPKNGKKA